MNRITTQRKIGKRGDTTLLKELLYLVIASVGLIVVIFVIAPRVMDFISGAPDKNSQMNFQRLTSEIDVLIDDYLSYDKNQKDFLQIPVKNIPININSKFGVIFYNSADDKPQQCKKDVACACLIYAEGYISNVKNKVFNCKSFTKDFNFDVNYASFDSTSGSTAGFISTDAIYSYKLFVSSTKTIGVVPEIPEGSVNSADGIVYESFEPDHPSLPIQIESLYHKDYRYYDRRFPIDTIVVHFSVTRCASELKCPVSTVGVLKQRGLSAHYSIERDGTIIQSLPERLMGAHAGCLGEYQEGISATREEWRRGRLLCNDNTYQNRDYTRAYFEKFNDNSIGVEMTAIVYNPEGSSDCDVGYLKTQGINYMSGDILLYKPSSATYCWQRYTGEEMSSLAALTAEIVYKYKIPFDYKHIIGHEVIAGDKIDPGPAFDWNAFMTVTAGILKSKYNMDVTVPTRQMKTCTVGSNCVCYERFNLVEEESRRTEKASCRAG